MAPDLWDKLSSEFTNGEFLGIKIVLIFEERERADKPVPSQVFLFFPLFFSGCTLPLAADSIC